MTTEDPTTVDAHTTAPTVLMCRPTYFTVVYEINPWMHTAIATDTARAVRQWDTLVDTYRRLGFHVEFIDPAPGMPDMVYAANGGFVVDGTAIPPRFRHPQRAGEAPLYADWLARRGFRVVEGTRNNEGEGDFLLVGDVVYAGTGFRSDPGSHAEVSRLLGREVATLHLVDPRFYHLDTAFAVLDPAGGPGSVAYYPPAFDEAGRELLRRRFPDAVIASTADAEVLGLNLFSDGHEVVLAAQATALASDLVGRGFSVHPVDLSELLRGGGGVKCCTLELRW